MDADRQRVAAAVGKLDRQADFEDGVKCGCDENNQCKVMNKRMSDPSTARNPHNRTDTEASGIRMKGPHSGALIRPNHSHDG